MSRSASPERPPRDAAPPGPRFAQLDIVTNGRTACVYVVPDHTWGEQWPGRQKATKQLSLFESGVAKRQAREAREARETTRGARETTRGARAAAGRRRASEPPEDTG